MSHAIPHVFSDTMTEARQSPAATRTTWISWLRSNLFATPLSSLTTVILVYLIASLIYAMVDWAVLKAVWSVPVDASGADTSACRALDGAGACWAILKEKHRLILFGMYPYEEQWRPAITIALFVGLYIISAMRRFWNLGLAVIWAVALVIIGVLLWGGIAGLEHVPQSRWGGLALTLVIATIGVAVAFPLSILVALGRRSTMPVIRWLCTAYVELIRGVPLISLLFMASVMIPLFLPEGMNPDKLLRAQLAIILFFAAYLAEVVRGGLQALPKGQYEAASALGLSYWQTQTRIILPQALRIVIPPLVNTFIGFFKDTSLVLVIGLYDLLASAQVSITEPAWQGFGVEVYVFVGLIYLAFCFAMSKYSQHLERDGRRAGAR